MVSAPVGLRIGLRRDDEYQYTDEQCDRGADRPPLAQKLGQDIALEKDPRMHRRARDLIAFNRKFFGHRLRLHCLRLAWCCPCPSPPRDLRVWLVVLFEIDSPGAWSIPLERDAPRAVDVNAVAHRLATHARAENSDSGENSPYSDDDNDGDDLAFIEPEG